MSSVVRATLAEQAYRDLRSRILSGQLPGGRRLLPEELAQELSISPTPIKEALRRLEGDGLVISPLRKGAVVRRLSIADVEELYEARLLIELDAVTKAFEHGRVSPALIAGLAHALDQHSLYAHRGTLDDFKTALAFDREFHQLLMQAGGNGLIGAWHERILGQTHTVFVFLAGDYGRSVDEHRDVLAALRAGAPDQARAALRRHLMHSRENTLANARRSAGDAGPG